jgi:hypothetical protein
VVAATAATVVGGVVAASALDPFESELQAVQISATATAPANPARPRIRRVERSDWMPDAVWRNNLSSVSTFGPRKSDAAIAAFLVELFMLFPSLGTHFEWCVGDSLSDDRVAIQ